MHATEAQPPCVSCYSSVWAKSWPWGHDTVRAPSAHGWYMVVCGKALDNSLIQWLCNKSAKFFVCYAKDIYRFRSRWYVGALEDIICVELIIIMTGAEVLTLYI